ncbi:MAG: sigma-70 family RNA polymerase sigma factor [Alphaproteobacteria bacterium]|nr:sigma-70 family RNA polymerase sigma factor [Alphaproteobacteria bacterium]MDE2265764.1 sigma-70 family RNA polymerase sigma factor [Alphaproteobacteria bacterium]MDE2498848.1 sigma-70 family RNA polymerase sigma factor [Alphaproteobacteria bacterium]
MASAHNSNDDTPDWSGCIVAVARSQDRQRFGELFAHFAPRLKNFFMRSGATASVAEDLAQDTMLIVWHKAGYFDPARSSAATWIFTIARNLRIDLKRRQRDPRLLEEFYDLAPEPMPSDQVLSAERAARVRLALEQLPADQADVVRRSFFDDAPHADIARALNVPLGTVKSRIRLAMQRLRSLVEDIK